MNEAEVFSKPGSQNGPCARRCSHVECNIMRLEAACTCTYCGKPIGYERAFDRGAYAHVRCLEPATSGAFDFGLRAAPAW